MIVCSFLALKGNTQNIRITASNDPLNKVLIKIRDTYGAEFSFNDTETAKFRVSVNKGYKSLENALDDLFSDLPFSYDVINEVYVIYRNELEITEKPKRKFKKRKSFLLSGCILHAGQGEALPFSVIRINETNVVCDENGKFSFNSYNDSVFYLRVSHLGYFEKDTVVSFGKNKSFELKPATEEIEEVIVKDKLFENFTENGEEAGTIKINHMITKYMPGCSDNSVFNILRLQPGITASAELTNDLVIWGAYQGQSQVIFDGFNLFGLKNFNDNISAVNPYIIQHMQILKGGFNANYGDRIGGIVEINGKNGRVSKPSVDFSLSNFTMNGLIQLPVTKNSSLLLAGRKTYYQLYNEEDLPILEQLNKNTDNDQIINDFYPDYDFYDFNFKYSLRSESGDLFYISALRGKDNFSYEFDRLNENFTITKHTNELNLQKGASVYYSKIWNRGFNTSLLFGFSSLNSEYSDSVQLRSKDFSHIHFENYLRSENLTEEYKIQVKSKIPLNEDHILETGALFIKNTSVFNRDTFNVVFSQFSKSGEHFTFFAQDVLYFNHNTITYGGRVSYLPYLNTFYFEPRVSFSSDLTEKIRLNLAWGKYKQYISKSSVLDDFGNYYFIWTVADEEDIPVLRSTHFVSGISYQNRGFSLNAEAYYKNSFGITRYLRKLNEGTEDVYKGKSKSIGADIFIKQNFRGHSAWFSYSFGETKEMFSYQIYEIYRTAPHSQRHELKFAAMADFDPFYISANYVYGSGFSIITGNSEYPVFDTGPYKRLDASAVFKFSLKRISFETGLSVLNVLNADNIKLSNFERIPANQTTTINIYNEPIPFTPTIFLKLGF